MRPVLALVTGAAVAALGAMILAEYHLDAVTAVVAGVLFGLAVAEAVVWAGRDRGRVPALASAAIAAAGVVWGGWISVRNARGEPIPGAAWMAAAVAAVVAGVRVGGWRSAGR